MPPPSVVETLLDEGADANASSWEGFTPLHYAARHADARLVVLLLGRGARPAVIASSTGMTPLHVAAINGHDAVARVLVEQGVDPSVVDELGRTAEGWARAPRDTPSWPPGWARPDSTTCEGVALQ